MESGLRIVQDSGEVCNNIRTDSRTVQIIKLYPKESFILIYVQIICACREKKYISKLPAIGYITIYITSPNSIFPILFYFLIYESHVSVPLVFLRLYSDIDPCILFSLYDLWLQKSRGGISGPNCIRFIHLESSRWRWRSKEATIGTLVNKPFQRYHFLLQRNLGP